MTVPLMILALGSLVVGAWLEWSHGLSDLLAHTPSLAFLGEAVHNAAQEEMHITIAIRSTVLVLTGRFVYGLSVHRSAAEAGGKDNRGFGYGRAVPAFIRQSSFSIRYTLQSLFGPWRFLPDFAPGSIGM